MANTVLLTGITGYLGKHIALGLLEHGYFVLGALRDMGHSDEVRAALSERVALERLKFVELDLLSSRGWKQALRGVETVIHTASLSPSQSEASEAQDIQPALESTERLFSAAHAAGIARIVMTSSAVTMIHVNRPDDHAYSCADWTDLNHGAVNAYVRAKTMAERRAWDWTDRHAALELTVINPGLMLGPPLDPHYGRALRGIERLLSGKDVAMPDLGFPLVDVRDVACFHVEALKKPASIGRRFLAAECFETVPKLAQHLKMQLPDAPITTRIAPKPLVGVMSLFDPTLRAFFPQIGRHIRIDNSAAQRCFEMPFRPALQAAEETARYILNHPRPSNGHTG